MTTTQEKKLRFVSSCESLNGAVSTGSEKPTATKLPPKPLMDKSPGLTSTVKMMP